MLLTRVSLSSLQRIRIPTTTTTRIRHANTVLTLSAAVVVVVGCRSRVASCQELSQQQQRSLPPTQHVDIIIRQDKHKQQQPVIRQVVIIIQRLLHSTWVGLGHLTRFLQLAVYFTPPLLATPLLFFPGQPRHIWRMIFVKSLHWGGATTRKLGQWASTRPDLFGKSTREDLESLHSSVPVESWFKTKQTLDEAFDGKMDEIFSSFDVVPVGAGCIAQVHRATLRDGNQQVAVKVRRRDVARVVQRDVDLLVFLAWALESLVPPLRFLAVWETASNFSTFMTSQMDLRAEASHLSRFSKEFKKKSEVCFPKPLISKETVLVETFEDGVVLSKILALDHEKLPIVLRHKMAEVGMKTFLEMVIVNNHTHGDLHPGNMFLRTKPPFDLQHPDAPVEFDKLVLVDAGLVTELSDVDQNNFIALFEAVADGDGDRAARLMIERSRDPTSCRNPEGFVKGMSDIVHQVKLDSFRLDKVQIGTVLENVLRLVHEHQVRLEPNFTSLVVAIIVLEGVGRQLNPELDIFFTSLPMLTRAQGKYQAAVAKVGLKVGFQAISRKSRGL